MPFSAKRPPTDEHVISRHIGGRIKITEGACRRCARKSNNLYQIGGKSETTFFAYRLWAKLTKTNARGLPKMAAGNALLSPADAFNIAVTPQTRPAIFEMPDFPAPLFWSGERAPTHSSLRVSFTNFSEQTVAIQANLRPYANRKRRTQCEIRTYLKSDILDVTLREFHDIRGLYLFIAKTAYCFAVARFGPEAFDGADMRALLLGIRMDAATFVGGYHREDIDQLPRDSLHIPSTRTSRRDLWDSSPVR